MIDGVIIGCAVTAHLGVLLRAAHLDIRGRLVHIQHIVRVLRLELPRESRLLVLLLIVLLVGVVQRRVQVLVGPVLARVRLVEGCFLLLGHFFDFVELLLV